MNGVETLRCFISHSVFSEFVVILVPATVARLAAAKPIAARPSELVAIDDGDIDPSQLLPVLIVLLLVGLLNDDDDANCG